MQIFFFFCQLISLRFAESKFEAKTIKTAPANLGETRFGIGQESENNKWKHSNFNRLHSFFHKNVFFFLKRLKEIEIASNKITTTFLILGHFEALMFF